ncbi:WD repeat-containing protein 91 [Glycine soja]|uniref:WD repeat-containing protein 91 n=1 Tax=Glycine soja TaxID=3848 RepID=A0A445KLZ2_GLYSO|nr:WD repeat-containing protein 91 [Glycine soja]
MGVFCSLQLNSRSLFIYLDFVEWDFFTNTLESYEAELRTDIGKGFEVDKILDLIFSLYVPKFHADCLLALLGFFKHYLSSSSDAPLASMLSKLETSLLRFYVIHVIQCNRNDNVVNFFTLYGVELL